MPPRIPPPPAATLGARGCPRCSSQPRRAFATTPRILRLGPEHPYYIPVPAPPQQTIPDRTFIKGRLPVPRDVFAHAEKGQDKASQEWLDRAAAPPKTQPQHGAGSYEAWKQSVSERRRRNLREGLAGLRVRRTEEERRMGARAERNRAEREAALHAPPREDERLTAPSHGLDLDHLRNDHVNGVRVDPSRALRLARSRANLSAIAAQKRADRAQHVHALYTHAASFITTPSQLDAAIDEAFGSVEQPVTFVTADGMSSAGASVWAYGKPSRVQDLLNRANGNERGSALAAGRVDYVGVGRERVGRIVEAFTGGKLAGGEAR